MPRDCPLAGQEANPKRNNIGVINLLFIVDFYLRANLANYIDSAKSFYLNLSLGCHFCRKCTHWPGLWHKIRPAPYCAERTLLLMLLQERSESPRQRLQPGLPPQYTPQREQEKTRIGG